MRFILQWMVVNISATYVTVKFVMKKNLAFAAGSMWGWLIWHFALEEKNHFSLSSSYEFKMLPQQKLQIPSASFWQQFHYFNDTWVHGELQMFGSYALKCLESIHCCCSNPDTLELQVNRQLDCSADQFKFKND